MLPYRPDLDGLRGLAVLGVIVTHAGFPILTGGYVGVDIFFVLSGYLITAIMVGDLERGRFSIMRFYERRARRILPALTVFLIGTVLIGALVFPPWQYEALADR